MKKNHLIRLIPYSLFLIPALTFGAFGRDLTVGSRGVDVEDLQKFLTAQGVYSGPITGYFGNLTKAGVAKFQEVNGISPTAGYFGPKTRALADQKSGASSEVSAPAGPVTAVDLQKQIEALMAELQKLQSAGTATTAPAVPSPAPAPELVVPAPFSGSVKIFSVYPNLTLSSYSDIPLNEYQLSGSADKVAITRLRVTNTGTLSDVYFNEMNLVDSSNNQVLAVATNPSEKVFEFTLVADNSKTNKGLMVSGGVYAIKATLKTPSSGGEGKPNVKLDILSSSDITAVDYDTLSKPADLSGNVFPVDGPYITTF